MSVLIVDDSLDNRLLIRKFLESDYPCIEASNGNAALDVLGSESVDLALLDIMMPGMTGLSLFQHIMDLYPEVAVIFVTSVDDLRIAVEHLKKGAYEYIVKPVTRERLRGAVDESLEKRASVLEEKQQQMQREERLVRQNQELESRAREISSINRLIQADLTQRFDEVEPLSEGGIAFQSHWQGTQLAEVPYGVQTPWGAMSAEGPNASMNLEAYSGSLTDNTPGLVPMLRSLVQQFRRRVNVELYVEADIEGRIRNDNRLSFGELQKGMRRILEEALDNVVKHAHAKSAIVMLRQREDGRICLDVIDNGRGFLVNGESDTIGLLAMKHYSAELGGVFRIASIPGQGTIVRVIL